jgi:hypothetical protein
MGAGGSVIEPHKAALKARYDKMSHLSQAECMTDLSESLKREMMKQQKQEEWEEREEERNAEKAAAKLAQEELDRMKREAELQILREEEARNPKRFRKKDGLSGSWNRVGVKSTPNMRRPRSVKNITTVSKESDLCAPKLDQTDDGPLSVDLGGGKSVRRAPPSHTISHHAQAHAYTCH